MDGARRAGPQRPAGVEPDAPRAGRHGSPTASSSSSTTRTSAGPEPDWTPRQLDPAARGRAGDDRSGAAAGCSPARPTVGLVVAADGRDPIRLRKGTPVGDDQRPDRRVRALRLRPQGRRRRRARRPARRRRRRRPPRRSASDPPRERAAATDRLPRDGWLDPGDPGAAHRGPRAAHRRGALRQRPRPARASCTPSSPAPRSPTPRSARSTSTTPWRRPASSPCSPPPTSASRRTTASSPSTPTSPGRRWPTASSASSARRSPSSSPRPSTAAADGAAAVWADYDPLAGDRRPRGGLRRRRRRSIFPDHGSNQALVADRRRAGRPRRRSATSSCRGRYVNQRMAVVPMEPNGCAAVPGDDGRLTFYASTQMPHVLHGQLAGALGIDAADVHVIAPQVGGGFGGKAGHLRRVLGRRRRGPPPRPAGDVDADAQRRPRVARRTAAARSSTPSSAAAATARSPGCASASSATAAPTPASAPSCRPAPSGCPTAPTASRRSSSTSPSPSPTRPRWAPTAAPAGPRRRRCSSGSSTTPPSSWASTRSSCAGATSSPTTCSRSPR